MRKLILATICCTMMALGSSCDKDETIEPERLKTPDKCMGCRVRDNNQVNNNIKN